MQVIEIFSVNQQIQHIVSLPADLQACLNPIDFSVLKELSGFESLE